MRSLALAIVLASIAPLAHAGSVEVRISNVGPKGAIYAQLCTQAEFRKTCALRAKVEPKAGETVVVFANVAPGRYAASVFQDLDGNGRLSFGMMGAPVEPWGMSRGAKAIMGPPAFSDAVVEVPSAPVTIPVALSK